MGARLSSSRPSMARRMVAAPAARAAARRPIAPPAFAGAALAAAPAAPRARAAAPSRRAAVAVAARYAGGGAYRSAQGPNIGERILAAIPFLLPFLDAFSYGRFLFFQFPMVARAVAPMAPLLALYHTVPFAALICFFGLYIGVVNNMQLPRFVRFSAMQAVLLDILLVLPRLLEQLVSPPTTMGPALQAYIAAQNAIWVAVAGCVVYGVASALLGRESRIPFIADAAEQQVR